MVARTRPVAVRKPETSLKEWRCPTCGRLLARLSLRGTLVLEIRCTKCGVTATTERAA